jgi:hypothetical protein
VGRALLPASRAQLGKVLAVSPKAGGFFTKLHPWHDQPGCASTANSAYTTSTLTKFSFNARTAEIARER